MKIAGQAGDFLGNDFAYLAAIQARAASSMRQE